MAKDQLGNGSVISTVPNGKRHQSVDGGRAIHDGFATIRSSGIKRNRTAPTITADHKPPKSCTGCCVATMEPLWEERNGKIPPNPASTVVRRDSKIPWWEVATRRSRYRSCPAFSQASIVSALEQTVCDVTDRLERLASSPDLKAAEAEELRKSAAVLRRQSSAVSQSVSSGYFSLERQPSCDSVSSVSSSLSNTTHLSYNSLASRQPNHTCANEHPLDISPDQSKQKKRNWLRASFRKAFGKQTRKRTKTDDGLEEAVPMQSLASRTGSNRYFSCSSLHRKSSATEATTEATREHRLFAPKNFKDSTMVARLQQLLIEKERIIADTRVELMNAQVQAQKQSDTINRLQLEAAALKEDNTRLSTVVQNKYGSVGEPAVASIVHNFNTLTINNSSGQYATLKSVQGNKIKILVAENVDIVSPLDASKIDRKSLSPVLIGSVSIFPKTTWEELDNLVTDKFEDYCSRYDPGASLGLGRESVYCYRLAEALRAEGFVRPDLLPYGYCVGEIDSLHLWLKGPLQKDSETKLGSMASICFEQGVPATTMKHLMGLLGETRRMILVGPHSCGKTSLAQTLARHHVATHGTSANKNAILTFKVDSNNYLELSKQLANVWPRGNSSAGGTTGTSTCVSVPEVIVIENIHSANGFVETLQRCLPSSCHSGPVVIVTSENAPTLITRLQVHRSFRWFGLSVEEEPVRGLLGRALRRSLLEAEETTGVNLPAVHRTIDWINRLWIHLNTILSGAGLSECLGPTLFAECPLDQEKARIWFTAKWNTEIVPLISGLIKDNLQGWVDPKDWISTTYPWSSDASGLTQLMNITPPENKRKVAASPSLRIAFPQRQIHCNSSNDNTSIRTQSDSLSSSSSSSLSKDIMELSKPTTNYPDNSPPSSDCSDIYSVPYTKVSVAQHDTYDTLSIYRKPRINTEILNQCKLETFTPITYRREFKPTLSSFHQEVTHANGIKRS